MIEITINGLDDLLDRLQKMPELVQSYIKVGADGTSVGDLALQAIHQSIDDVGLQTRSAHLKQSFRIASMEQTPDGIIYRIATDASYALRLNDGGPPSSLYTPGGESKMMGGNKPYHYLEKANLVIAEKLSARISAALDRAVGELGFK